MDSGLISKIEKAKRYAEERDRIAFRSFAVDFRGDHSTYRVSYEDGQWQCTCPFSQRRGICSHTMALERVLEGMLPAVPEETSEAAAR
jgi:hypothetical protein